MTDETPKPPTFADAVKAVKATGLKEEAEIMEAAATIFEESYSWAGHFLRDANHIQLRTWLADWSLQVVQIARRGVKTGSKTPKKK